MVSFPEDVFNPFFEIVLPLIHLGLLPYNIGRGVGLGGVTAWIPYGLLICGSVLFCLLGAVDIRRFQFSITNSWIRGILIVLISAITFYGLSLPKTPDPNIIAYNIELAKQQWEPK